MSSLRAEAELEQPFRLTGSPWRGPCTIHTTRRVESAGGPGPQRFLGCFGNMSELLYLDDRLA